MSADDKPRELSEEDQTLWRSVTRSVRPLKRQPVRREPHQPSRARTKALPLLHSVSPARTPLKKEPPPLMPIDRRLKQGLARGMTDIDACLDLHGRTLNEAHVALVRFLRRAQGEGARIVLVITGKGSDAAGGRGVLRRQVPLWLALPELRAHVLGIDEANTAHGGAGALYVRLRRGR